MFKHFPNLGYIEGKRIVTVADIFRRVSIVEENLNSYNLEYYTILDGEQPEDVAYKLYGDPELHWTVLLVNNIVDPYNDWYLTTEILDEFVKQKYGADFLDTHHHWILPERPEICVEYDRTKLANGEIIPVTNKEHEEILNDARQEIRVVNPNQIQDFVKEYRNKIRL